MLVVHHVTYSTNPSAISSAAARSPRATSRAPLLARCRPSGEAWHNNHHAFPPPRRSTVCRWEIDVSGLRDQRPREGRTRLGRRACGARAHEAEGSRRDRRRYRPAGQPSPAPAPLRDELERTLPERPFSADRTAPACRPPTAAARRSAFVSSGRGRSRARRLDSSAWPRLRVGRDRRRRPRRRSRATRQLEAAADRPLRAYLLKRCSPRRRACGLQPPPRAPASSPAARPPAQQRARCPRRPSPLRPAG